MARFDLTCELLQIINVILSICHKRKLSYWMIPESLIVQLTNAKIIWRLIILIQDTKSQYCRFSLHSCINTKQQWFVLLYYINVLIKSSTVTNFYCTYKFFNKCHLVRSFPWYHITFKPSLAMLEIMKLKASLEHF